MFICLQIQNFKSFDQFVTEIKMNAFRQVANPGPYLSLSTVDNWETGEPARQGQHY
jgi:hypothetical protein